MMDEERYHTGTNTREWRHFYEKKLRWKGGGKLAEILEKNYRKGDYESGDEE